VKLQASDASSLESLQSQSQRGAENRIRFNGLKLVHRRLVRPDRMALARIGVVQRVSLSGQSNSAEVGQDEAATLVH
jgi:hypothetical protein